MILFTLFNMRLTYQYTYKVRYKRQLLYNRHIISLL